MRWVIVFLFLFCIGSVNAISFEGYVNGDFNNPVSIDDSSITNDCEDVAGGQATCDIQGQPHGGHTSCFSCNTFGPNYVPDNYLGNPIGDVGRNCFWGNHPSEGWGCYNRIVYGNALFGSGWNPGCNGDITCFVGNPSDPECNWVRGSFVSRSGYCSGGYIEYPTSRQDCVGSSGGYFTNTGNTNYELPSIDSAFNEGVCYDACEEDGSQVIDYELCSSGMIHTGTLTTASSSCPKTTYDDYCVNGNTLKDYSCDGSPIYGPGDRRYDYLVNYDRLDGEDMIYTNVDCSLLYPSVAPVCDDDCGSLPIGSGNDICKSEKPVGVCGGAGNNGCVNESRPDLDDNQVFLDGFNLQCPGSYLGTVEWAQGGIIGDFGEYSNDIMWVDYIDMSFTFTMDRGWFDFEACGDDEQEYNIGGLCCDDFDDYVLSIADNVIDPLNMAGDYCVDSNDCGNMAVEVDSGEDCDAMYVLYQMYNFSASPSLVLQEPRLVLGDDSGCAPGDICSNACTCVAATDICGDGIIQAPNSNGVNETCDGAEHGGLDCTDFGHLDPAGLVCVNCAFDDSGCGGSIPGGDPEPVVGPNEYQVNGVCTDDGDGDKYGIKSWVMFNGNGVEVGSGSNAGCVLDIEEIPLFGFWSVLLFFIILFIFYSNEKIYK